MLSSCSGGLAMRDQRIGTPEDFPSGTATARVFEATHTLSGIPPIPTPPFRPPLASGGVTHKAGQHQSAAGLSVEESFFN